MSASLSACCQTSSTKENTIESCEGCKAYQEFGNKRLTAIDTLPEFEENEPLKLTGTVYQRDGKTPASDVILYIYHTNLDGVYPKRGTEKGYARWHGYLRGWIKTDRDGKYTFYTFRPGAYPSRGAPEHVHVTVKEPDKTEYYIDDFFFDDDSLLTDRYRKSLENRGGSGIMNLQLSDGIKVAKRDIILGLNIPNYPE